MLPGDGSTVFSELPLSVPTRAVVERLKEAIKRGDAKEAAMLSAILNQKKKNPASMLPE
jgi:hypothetical protein